MPLPLIIGGIAAIAGAAGVGAGVHGGIKMKDANDAMTAARIKHERALELFNKRNTETTDLMDSIGTQELEILSSFDDFSNVIEKIQGRPEFKTYSKDGIDLPEYEGEELKKVSAGAGALLGGVGGAAAGTAGGFAAAGATTAAITAIGTASTGTAISTLSGAAATNAVLAALGGGSIAAGGGGMALGTAVLGGATLGVGLLVGGIIFNVTGTKLSDKADEAFIQAKRTESEVNTIVAYLDELTVSADKFKAGLVKTDEVYRRHLTSINEIVIENNKTQWSDFSDNEKKTTENTVLLVGLLYKMCQVNLVLKQGEDEVNLVNKDAVDNAVNSADKVLSEIEG